MNWKRIVGVSCLVVVMQIVQCQRAPAQRTAVAQDSVQESGQVSGQVPLTADQMLGSTPWYDSADGKLVPVTVRERFDDSVNRKSRWLPQAQKVKKPVPVNTNAANTNTGGGTGLLGSDVTLGNVLGWLVLVGGFLAVIGMLIYTLTKAEIDLDAKKTSAKNTSGDLPDEQLIERMKHLPAELRRTDVNLRTEAKRLMEEGQFDQAVILLFGHQLLMLDRAGLLRLTRGKTNGRYVRETRSADRESGDCLRVTATAFERSYFGRHQLTRVEFASLWSNNEQLEKCIDLLQEVAA